MRLVKNALLLLVVFVAFSGIAEAFTPASYTPSVPSAQENVFETNAYKFECPAGQYLKSFSFDSQVCEPLFPTCSVGQGLSVVDGSWRCERFVPAQVAAPEPQAPAPVACPYGDSKVVGLEAVGNITNGQGGARLARPVDVYVKDDYAYVISTGSNALQIIDISVKETPRAIGNITLGGGAKDVYVKDNHAYVVSSFPRHNLQIIDISNPRSPRAMGNIDRLSAANSVFVKDNYAYVVSYLHPGRLWIIDVSNSISPSVVSSLSGGEITPILRGTSTTGAKLSYASRVSVKDNHAYVRSRGAIQVIDISNPTIPRAVSSLSHRVDRTFDGDLFVKDDYVYLASRDNFGDSLRVIGISEPESPRFVGRINHSRFGAPKLYWAKELFAQGNYAYVISSPQLLVGSGTLQVIDISNQTNPTATTSISDSRRVKFGGAQSVFVKDNYAYVASYSSDALQIIEIICEDNN